MKPEAVGLRGAAKSMPSEPGGMARRAALARAIALEPDSSCSMSRLSARPDNMGVLVKLISPEQRAGDLRRSRHDVPECSVYCDHARRRIKIVAHGEAGVVVENTGPRQFLDGIADGPVPFRHPAGDYLDLLETGVKPPCR